MIFQEPMSSLNPCFTVGFQIGESLKTHLGLDRRQRDTRVVELLAEVGIPDPARRAHAYPHQLSGGMSQRVMIAMALACRPKLLIADEPTTALDVTIQAQILDLLLALRRENGMGLVLITHDMGVVAETAGRVIVQYAGQQVEANDTREPLRRSASSLYCSPARRSAGAGDGAAAAGHSRRCARSVRPAARVPVLAALPVRLRRLPPRRRPATRRRTSAPRSATRRSSAAFRKRRRCLGRARDAGHRSPRPCARLYGFARRLPRAGDG